VALWSLRWPCGPCGGPVVPAVALWSLWWPCGPCGGPVVPVVCKQYAKHEQTGFFPEPRRIGSDNSLETRTKKGREPGKMNNKWKFLGRFSKLVFPESQTGLANGVPLPEKAPRKQGKNGRFRGVEKRKKSSRGVPPKCPPLHICPCGVILRGRTGPLFVKKKFALLSPYPTQNPVFPECWFRTHFGGDDTGHGKKRASAKGFRRPSKGLHPKQEPSAAL